jgi:Tol biopolymer transport system component
LPCPREYCEATDWTTDDQLIVNVRDPGGGDVWIVPLNTARGARPLLAEGYDERDARIAPRRDWVAYVSNESGRPEVSVRSVAGGAKRIVISAGGGDQPVWRRDGGELFFVDPQGRLQSASVTWNSAGTPVFGRPTALPVPPIGFGHWGTQYDVSPDGRQLYFVRRNDETGPREIQVVLGWRGLLKS